MDQFARRALLETDANPHERLDYLVILSGRVTLPGATATLRLRYVPDRRILKVDAFHRYIEALAGEPAASLEALTAAFLDDANNELVPRWVQVSAATDEAGQRHVVMLEDRQPRWENPALLTRLRSDI